MTMEEVSKAYGIPMSVLLEYERWGLCGEAEKRMGARHYDETDLERLSLILTLYDVGFSSGEIERYMRLAASDGDSMQERMAMLRKKRDGTLDELHFKQRQLDRLDYLRYRLAQSGKEK